MSYLINKKPDHNKIIDPTETGVLAHRITTYSHFMPYKEVKTVLSIDAKSHPVSGYGVEATKYYKYAVRFEFMGCSIVILFGRTKRHKNHKRGPFWKMIITYPTPEALHFLASNIPGLIISRAEITIDFYCIDSRHVASLFWLLRKYLYVPRGMSVQHKGGELEGTSDLIGPISRKENAVYQILDFKGRVVQKVYERGGDRKNTRKKPTWKHKETYRVRWEYEYKASKKNNKRFKINSIYDFLDGNAFNRIITALFDLRMFIASDELPAYWEEYKEQDNAGYGESFQLEYIAARKKGLEPSNCDAKAWHLDGLIERVRKACVEADSKFDIANVTGEDSI